MIKYGSQATQQSLQALLGACNPLCLEAEPYPLLRRPFSLGSKWPQETQLTTVLWDPLKPGEEIPVTSPYSRAWASSLQLKKATTLGQALDFYSIFNIQFKYAE